MINEQIQEYTERLKTVSDALRNEVKLINETRMKYHDAYYRYELLSIISNNSIDSKNFKEFILCQDEFEKARIEKTNAEIQFDTYRSMIKEIHLELKRLKGLRDF